MAKRRSENSDSEMPDIDLGKLTELEDVARGVEGSQGEVSLSPEHADVYEKLGGNLEDAIDTGSGGVMVSCVELCNVVLGEPARRTEGGAPVRRRLGNRIINREEGTASKARKAIKAGRSAKKADQEAATAAVTE